MILESMRRGVGFCLNTQCENYARSVFLLNHGEYKCDVCRVIGINVEETGTFEEVSENWKEVRVEYDYCPLEAKYKSIAIITDNSLEGIHNVYTLRSPLIKTAKRASKTAENLLATLQGFKKIEVGCVPRALPKEIHFDAPLDEVKRELDIISKTWDGLKS